MIMMMMMMLLCNGHTPYLTDRLLSDVYCSLKVRWQTVPSFGAATEKAEGPVPGPTVGANYIVNCP